MSVEEAGGLATPAENPLAAPPGANPPGPPDLPALWEPVRARLYKRLLGLMTSNHAGSQRTEAGRVFRWAIEQQLRPADITAATLPELHARFVASLDDLRGPDPKRQSIRFYRLRALGKRALEEVLLDEPPEPVIRKPTGKKIETPSPTTSAASASSPTHIPEVPPMATRDNEEEPELIDEGDEGEDEGTEPPLDEVRPSRRPPRRATQQPVFVVQPAPRRALPKVAPPRSKLLSTPEKIRLYKRGMGGKRILVNDYTTDDIGNMSLHVFIKDYVDPEFGDPSGLTTYEAVSVNPINDKDTGASSTVTIESAPQPEHANSPIGQVRDTIGLIQEMQEMNAQKTSRQSELLAEAQKSAVGKGDLSQLMVLMLLDKFQNKSSEAPDLLKVVEMLQRGHSMAPAQSLANLPAMPAYMPPPLPPPQPSALDKVLEVLLTNMMRPPPPQPTFLEQMMQYQQMQQMMGGGAVATQLAALQHRLEQPKAAGGIEESLTMFEKLSAAVKTLAPQLNMGGLTGALQTIITPELGKALGGVIAQGIEQRAKGADAPAPAPAPARPAVDPVIVGKVQSLRIAQTPPVQVQATIDLVQAMWMGAFKPQLDPVLGALLAGDVGPARAALLAILTDARADLATPAFVDDVLRAMAAQTGQEVPAALKLRMPEPAKEAAAPPVETAPPPAVPVVTFAPPVPEPEEPYVEHQPTIPKPKLAETELLPRAEPVLAVARG